MNGGFSLITFKVARSVIYKVPSLRITMGIKQKIQSYKDQLMFVFFQLILYVVDIGTDMNQAAEFWK